jgi:hypothetical protein
MVIHIPVEGVDEYFDKNLKAWLPLRSDEELVEGLLYHLNERASFEEEKEVEKKKESDSDDDEEWSNAKDAKFVVDTSTQMKKSSIKVKVLPANNRVTTRA